MASAAAHQASTTPSAMQPSRTGTGCGTITRIRRSTRPNARWGCPRGQMGNSEVGHLNIGAGPRRLPGLHAHRPRHRDGRVRIQSGDREAIATARRQPVHAARAGAAVARRRAQPRAADCGDGRGGRDAAVRRVCSCMHSSTGATRRRAAPPRRSTFMADICAQLPGAASPTSSAATTRWTATSAGSASAGLRSPGRRRGAAIAAADAQSGARRCLRPRRKRRIRQGNRNRRRRRRPCAMDDGDVVVFMNFRADRARQMTRALTDPGVRRLSTRTRAASLRAYV